MLDPDLLNKLAELNGTEDWMLISGDDRMPAEHGDKILNAKATVATILNNYPEGMTEHFWRTDVVHRWAHTMQNQSPQTVRRYSFSGSTVWTPRKRHLRQIAKHGWIPWRAEDARREADTTTPIPSTQDRLPGFA